MGRRRKGRGDGEQDAARADSGTSPGKRARTSELAAAPAASGPSVERVVARPAVGRFKPTEIGKARHDDVTLTNVSDEPVDFFDFLGDVLDGDGVGSPGDFTVVGGASDGEPLAPSASQDITVEFEPKPVHGSGRSPLRRARFAIVDTDGATAGSFVLEGRARAPTEKTVDDGAVAQVTQTARTAGAPPAPPESYDGMRRHLAAAARLMETSERDDAADLVGAVATRMSERLRYDQVWQAFRAYGLGARSATMMVAHARDEVNAARVRLSAGFVVDLDAVLASFELAKEPIQLVLGEIDHAPSVQAMHDASPAVLAGKGVQELGETAVEAFSDAGFAAGFGVGVLEGAAGAVVDLATGAAEVVSLAFDIARQLVAGGLIGAAAHAADELASVFAKAPAALAAMGPAFAAAWNASESYPRGNFRGEVIGYVATQIAIVIISGGAAAEGVAFASLSRWGKLVAIIQKLDAAGDVITWATKMKATLRLPKGLATKGAAQLPDAQVASPSDVRGSARDAGDAPRANDNADAPIAVEGFAQGPRITWRKNPDGRIRTLEEAIELARRHGVDIPDDILLRKVKGKYLPPDTYARYLQRSGNDPNASISWDDFYSKELDEILVHVDEKVFESDEALVAILAHEMHELNNLRRLFDESGGAMTYRRLHFLINPGIKGNLHDQAWDVADRAVLAMRRAQEQTP